MIRAARGSWLLVPALLLACLNLGDPTFAADERAPFERAAARHGQRAPLVRIGLASSHSIEIDASGGFRVLDPQSGEAVWKDRFTTPIQVVAQGGPTGDVPKRYRVQVGAFTEESRARAELGKLEAQFSTQGIVHYDPDRGNWRVRLGDVRKRNELQPLIDRLRDSGMARTWVAEEPLRPSDGSVRLRFVDASYDSLASDRSRVLIVPAGKGRLKVGEKRYRGVIELRIDAVGQIRPINWVARETYLRGVVPAELGPEVWPELEALKAQAVAARTYIQRNLGQFEQDGYDICDTPRCQVYAGSDAEHPLSDRAIAATRNEVLTYEGQPIVAYYTATCGGHTEDGDEVFPGDAGPYLVGVPSRADAEVLAGLKATLRGAPFAPRVDASGRDVTRDAALLAAAGVISRVPPQGPLSGDDLRKWTAALARLAGLPAASGTPRQGGLLETLAEDLVRDLGWQRRGEWLLGEGDLAPILRDPAAVSLSDDAQRALAILVRDGGLQPHADGSLGVGQPVDGARFLPMLATAGEDYRAFGLKEGTFSRVESGGLRLVRGKGWSRRVVAKDALLVGWTGGRQTVRPELELWPGDRVRYRVNDAGRVDYLELNGPVKGSSDDRSSRVYSWQLRKTRRELETTINRRLSIGKLKDLRVVRRGVSGRIVELEVVGSKATTTVNGFEIRGLFGSDLRDLLLVMDIQRDRDGDITAVLLTGKGWGHGVGLCQVGAYGMAMRGESYREILHHYYSNVKLESIDGR